MSDKAQYDRRSGVAGGFALAAVMVGFVALIYALVSLSSLSGLGAQEGGAREMVAGLNGYFEMLAGLPKELVGLIVGFFAFLVGYLFFRSHSY